MGSFARPPMDNAGQFTIIFSNLMCIFPTITFGLAGHHEASALSLIAGTVSFVFHACFKGWFCMAFTKDQLDYMDVFFAANLAVVVGLVFCDGTSTPYHSAYRLWRQMRSLTAVLIVGLMMILSLTEAHRVVMPVVGVVIGLLLLWFVAKRHVGRDPALKKLYGERKVALVVNFLLLLVSASLLHYRGRYFNYTHTLWHTAVFTHLGIVGLLVAPHYRTREKWPELTVKP